MPPAGPAPGEHPRIAVVGAGSMGAAILRGLVKAGWSPGGLMATGPRAERMSALGTELGIRTSTDNLEAARFADVVVLGVKPQILTKVLDDVRPAMNAGKLVISIAAGVPTHALEAHLPPGTPVVRSMPNLPVVVGTGATALCKGAHARAEHIQTAHRLFEAVGVAVEVAEDLMDAVTGLSGTGPMYIFAILEGLSDAGVKVGLSRHVANQLATQTLIGAARLAQASGEHPAALKDRVTSPGGTAIAALHTMERNGLKALLMDAVEAATRRSAELGARYGDGRKG